MVHSQCIPMLSETIEQLNEMIFICTADLVFWNSIYYEALFLFCLFLSKSWGRSRTATTSNYYHKVPHLKCCCSPRSTSEMSYSKRNIPFQFWQITVMICCTLFHIWLFLNLGPTITWNWKLKQNIRLLIILTLEPVAYNLRTLFKIYF